MLHKGEVGTEYITWIASYPKSGNTWLRSLLQAYRCGGYLNINDLHTVTGDSGASAIRAVSCVPLEDLGLEGALMLRPAGLLNTMMCKPVPRLLKTHFANLKPTGVPEYIPKMLTTRAVYMVRDPRDIIMSFSKHFGTSLQRAIHGMNREDHWIGGTDTQTAQVISSWSNHVASWLGEDRYPVKVVKYEDLAADPHGVFTEIVEFLEWEVDEEMVAKAVEACELSKLSKQEEEAGGFVENPLGKERGEFFNKGGSRYLEELGPKWIAQIEEDHGKMMRKLGYLEDNVVELENGDGDILPQ